MQINISSPLIWKFRTLLDDLIQRKIKTPRCRYTRNEEIVLETFDNMLSAEDSSKGLFHPPGVGDRPLFIYNKVIEYSPSHNEVPLYSRPSFTNADKMIKGFIPRNDDNSNNQSARYGKHPYRPVPQNRFNAGASSCQIAKNDCQEPSFSGGSSANHRRPNHNEATSPILINAIAPKNIIIPVNARFFVIRPTEIRNIIISVSQGTWNFSPQTEKKIFRLYMVSLF